MRCPKCHYISFDADPRCRNCGYDFALASGDDTGGADLTLRVDEAPSAPADLPLGAREEAADPAARRRRAAAGPADLPLFEHARPADEAALGPAASPRPPLAVRRPVRETPRPHVAAPRADPLPAPSDTPARDVRLGLEEAGEPEAPALPDRGPHRPRPEPAAAPAWRRLAALAVDAAILGGIDLLVLVFTLRLTGLELARAAELPGAPLAAFLLLLDGGYLVLFTAASGQTIGKMLAGVRVVGETTSRVALGTAAARAAASLVTLLTAGAGYLPALAGRDRRALHDRLAGTRVTRA
jgi:uncharacterized RDD family membrane protein YckC